MATDDNPMTDTTSLSELVREAWQDLMDVDDRNSPAEYPDMCLITSKELAEFMGRASRLMAQGGLAAAPSASLEVRDGLTAIAWYLDRWLNSTVERDYPDRSKMPENPTFLSLEADCHYNQIRHWITKLREFALQAERSEGGSPANPVDDGAVESKS